MARNIEIKAELNPQQAALIEEQAIAQASGVELLHQTDTFFHATTGRLKLREFGDGTAELIAYQRPDQVGPKLSSYVRHPCQQPQTLHQALAKTLGVRGIVEKSRRVFHIGQTRVHLDEVTALGWFLELEVVLRDDQSHDDGTRIADDLLGRFGIGSDSLIAGAYIDLLERLAADSR